MPSQARNNNNNGKNVTSAPFMISEKLKTQKHTQVIKATNATTTITTTKAIILMYYFVGSGVRSQIPRHSRTNSQTHTHTHMRTFVCRVLYVFIVTVLAFRCLHTFPFLTSLRLLQSQYNFTIQIYVCMCICARDRAFVGITIAC